MCFSGNKRSTRETFLFAPGHEGCLRNVRVRFLIGLIVETREIGCGKIEFLLSSRMQRFRDVMRARSQRTHAKCDTVPNRPETVPRGLVSDSLTGTDKTFHTERSARG